MRYKRSAELDTRLIELVEQEVPNYIIARQLEVSESFVSKTINKLGLKRKEWEVNVKDKHTGQGAYKSKQWTELLSKAWH